MQDRRKADARNKIQLGGLIVKAGLGSIDAMAILGLLVEHADALKDPGEQQRWREIGRKYAAATSRGDAADATPANEPEHVKTAA